MKLECPMTDQSECMMTDHSLPPGMQRATV